LFNSRLERLKTGGGNNESMALNDIEEKVKDMMQLSVEGMPSNFDCDSEIDTIPSSAYNYVDEVNGKIILIISCIFLQPKNNICTYTDFSDDFAMIDDDDGDSYIVTGKIRLHLEKKNIYIIFKKNSELIKLLLLLLLLWSVLQSPVKFN